MRRRSPPTIKWKVRTSGGSPYHRCGDRSWLRSVEPRQPRRAFPGQLGLASFFPKDERPGGSGTALWPFERAETITSVRAFGRRGRDVKGRPAVADLDRQRSPLTPGVYGAWTLQPVRSSPPSRWRGRSRARSTAQDSRPGTLTGTGSIPAPSGPILAHPTPRQGPLPGPATAFRSARRVAWLESNGAVATKGEDLPNS